MSSGLDIHHLAGNGSSDPGGSAGQGPASYSRARHFDRILTTRAVQPVFQPIVDLVSREVLAFEALARGPVGSPLERPDLLFGAARDLGLVRELDWVCRARAMDMAMQCGLGSGLTLFVNVEPDVAATRAPEDLLYIMKHAEQDLRVILEVTERALLQRPAELLHWLSMARERWWGVALDDVGAHADSLALMPFVNPDVIKMDIRFVRQEVLTAEDHRVIDAINAQAARTGATILAEGIENARHLERALEMGATLGQGWFFGRPTALPKTMPTPRGTVPMLNIPPRIERSGPWAILEDLADDHQQLPETHMRRVFNRVEQQASTSHEAPVVLVSFPPGAGPWGEVCERLERLRSHAAFCGAVGVDIAQSKVEGWHIMPLQPEDEMADEWSLTVIGPHHSQALVAYDSGERDATGQALWHTASSRDREAVIAVADHLLRRLGAPLVNLDGHATGL